MPVRADAQQEAVLAGTETNCVVIAPPGTGKTALAARLAARDADNAADHERVLVLTFSNQARGQLEREIELTLTAKQRSRVEVANYHQFFWSAVRAYRTALGLPFEIRMSSSGRRLALLRGADASAVQAIGRQNHLLDGFAEQAHLAIAPVTGLSEAQRERLLVVVTQEHQRGNLVFDDLGALFWTLINRYPAVRAAFADRYPFVIADEHQDASALQDALVRELGGRRRIILADPMQLIHGWRGADEARLTAHRTACEREYTLSTPHRWHGSPATAAWLLGVRTRLTGGDSGIAPPGSVQIARTDPGHGEGGMLAATRFAVLGHLQAGAKSVAVLARSGSEVTRIRDYLSGHGLRPRQLGASQALENGLSLQEDLAGLEGRALVLRALETIYAFVPTVPLAVRRQVVARLGETGSRKQGCGDEARLLLNAMDAPYLYGAVAFFGAVVGACEKLIQEPNHHLPRPDEFSVFESVAKGGLEELDTQLELFNRRLGALSRASRREDRGILTMTVHQAKGREFDAVVIFAATARGFPGTDDDKKLFYVAITRGVLRWTVVAPRGDETPLLASLG